MLKNLKIILASASPRRQELLSRLKVDFEIITSDVEEKTTYTKPDAMVKELSLIKAEAVLHQIMEQKHCTVDSEQQPIMVIGADTVVSKDNCIMGKPKSVSEAFRMIHSIQGSTHQVYTGVTILLYDCATGKIQSESFAERTDVSVFPMTELEIENYVATGDCMDKSGAYGIQGDFGIFVEKIDGDYNNVVGLPLARLYQVLKELEINGRNE